MLYDTIMNEFSTKQHGLISSSVELNESFSRMGSGMHGYVESALAIDLQARIYSQTYPGFDSLNESILTSVLNTLVRLINYALDFIRNLSEKVKNAFRSREEKIAIFLERYGDKVREKYRMDKTFTYIGRSWNMKKLMGQVKSSTDFGEVYQDFGKFARATAEYSAMARGSVLTDSEIDRVSNMIRETKESIKGVSDREEIQKSLESKHGKLDTLKERVMKDHTTNNNYEQTEIRNFAAGSPDEMLRFLSSLNSRHGDIIKNLYESDIETLGKIYDQIEKITKDMPDALPEYKDGDLKKDKKEGDDEKSEPDKPNNRRTVNELAAELRDISAALTAKIQATISVANTYRNAIYKVEEDASTEFMYVLVKYLKSGKGGSK